MVTKVGIVVTREQLEDIFGDGDEKEGYIDSKWTGDNAIKGLRILEKYFDIEKKDLIQGADHDVIWSVSVDDAIEAGLTVEDAEALALLNWTIDEDGECFSCFV